MGEIMLVAMSADVKSTASPMAVRPRSLAIPGVAQVIPIGGDVRQFQVTPDVAAMTRLDVSLDEVERAVKQFGANTGGGFVDQNGAARRRRNSTFVFTPCA